ncbi:uncharacterized protein LOC121599804 [Anopheles merus]|uniref:F-box domain-containing protein n=1 Tax=Anopheles merus TaxID=30066 RepID=A0A9I3MJB8_ANOME|nr:uncharacterized protein LOC121599804 [Anopheles merus]
MDSPVTGSPLEELPPELVLIIFKYLDLKSLKAVSLTCHRLEEIFSYYNAPRFVLRISELYPGNVITLPMKDIEEKVEQATIMLERTKRPYRNVHLDISSAGMYDDFDNMPTLLAKLFETRTMQQLVRLKLELPQHMEKFATQLSNALAKMDHLQELKLHHPWGRLTGPQITELKLVNRTLHKLELYAIFPSVIDCRNLRLLSVWYSVDVETVVGKQYVEHGGEEPYWKLKQLEELTIWHNEYTMPKRNHCSAKVQFYRHMTQLKKLCHNAGFVSDEMLQTICKSCVQLESLYLADMIVNNPNFSCFLSNLTNLRQLAIESSTNVLSFTGVRLPRLEKLLLDDINIDWASLAELKSIKWLKINPDRSTVKQMCDLLERHMNRLQFVWITFYDQLDLPCYREIFATLSKLPALKRLALDNVKNSSWLKEMTPLPGLTRIAVLCCSRETVETDDLEKLGPNIKEIKDVTVTDRTYTWDITFEFDPFYFA